MGLAHQPTPDIVNCASCGYGPLTRKLKNFRFHLTHSPNAEALRGFSQSNPMQGQHRHHIIQSDKWAWEYLCKSCYTECDHLPGTNPQPIQVYVYKILSSSDPSKHYEVKIKYAPTTSELVVLCQCAWATHHSNQDQGVNKKLCSHQTRAIEKHLVLYPPTQAPM